MALLAEDSNGQNSSSDERNARKLELEKFLRGRGISPPQASAELSKIKLAIEQGGRSYFVSIKGPELLSKWVGETESSIRSIFAMARERATFYTPVVLFFDELESMFSRRGSGISSDVQKTIVPQLLAEIDGVEETRNIIIIGASNRFDLIDQAVLRPGRLDFKIKIPRPDRDAARSILTRYLNADVPLLPRFVQEKLQAEHKQELGFVACEQSALDNSLGAALDNWVSRFEDSHSALFLTELYTGRRPPAQKILLHARSGTNLESADALIEAWGASDGIAWQTVRKNTIVTETTGAGKESQTVIACPLSMTTNGVPLILGVLVSLHSTQHLPEDLEPRMQRMSSALTGLLRARGEIANQLIERVLNILYSPESYLLITELVDARRSAQRGKPPRTMHKKVEEIVSGAMLESVISRAKRLAVRREINKQRQFLAEPGMPNLDNPDGLKPGREAELMGGIHWHDLYAAIRKECEEGKDQYIYELYADDPFGRDQAYQDTEKFHIDVKLPPEDAEISHVTWLVNKGRAWRKSHAEPIAPEDTATG